MLFCQKQRYIYNDFEIIYEIATTCGFKHRAPQIDLSLPYICCLGNGFTFGRFVQRPYPVILSEKLDIQVINLGFARMTPEGLRCCPIFRKILEGSTTSIAQFRFTELNVDLVNADVKVNWGGEPFPQVISVPCETQTNRKMSYPSQTSHELLAEAIIQIIKDGSDGTL